jgi:hypothetical protein
MASAVFIMFAIMATSAATLSRRHRPLRRLA